MTDPASTSQHDRPGFRMAPLLKEIFRIWITERPDQFAASMAYYAIFSFVPVIYIALSITNRFIDRISIGQQIYELTTKFLGETVAKALQNAVFNLAGSFSGSSVLTSVISFLLLLFTASLLFFQLRFSLNSIWKVPPPSKNETRAYLRDRLLAFVMILGVIFLLIVVSITTILVSFFDRLIVPHTLTAILSSLILFGLSSLSFVLIYKGLSNAVVSWQDAWVGAITAGVFLTIFLYITWFILGAGSVSSPLEVAGTSAIILSGFYFVGLIFVLGAVVTRVNASLFGRHIVPRADQDSKLETGLTKPDSNHTQT